MAVAQPTSRLTVWGFALALAACEGGSSTGDGRDATDTSATTSTGTESNGASSTSRTTGDSAPASTSSSDSTSGSVSGAPSPDDSGSSDTQSDGDSTGPAMVALPPVDGGLDYQLGEAYNPPRGVAIVSRDRTAAPAPGIYNICYINGFQAQPGEEDFWLEHHPDLVLRDGNGDPVIDEDWNEMLLDPSTAAKREALLEIMSEWVAGCAAAGFDAIEVDNLDSYSRSDGRLEQDHAVAYMGMLSEVAHQLGLASSQKNSTEILDRAVEMATDFAVAEECSQWDECQDYVDTYGDGVLMIEYRRVDFEQGCRDFPGHPIVLRDLNLVGPRDADYVFEGC